MYKNIMQPFHFKTERVSFILNTVVQQLHVEHKVKKRRFIS